MSAQGNPELVDDDSFVVPLFFVADDDVVDEGELVGVGTALIPQVLLRQSLLGQLGRAVRSGDESPATDQRVAVALDREDLLVRVLTADQEAGLGTGMQAVIHAVLREAVEDSPVRLDVDVDVDVFDEDVHRLRTIDQLDLEPQGLAVGDPPRLGVVVRRVGHRKGDVLTRDGRLDGVATIFT